MIRRQPQLGATDSRQASALRVRSPRADAQPIAPWNPLTVLVPGLMLWFGAILVRSSADLPDAVAPTAALLGTAGLFLRLPLLAKSFWFRTFLGALGLLFLVRLALFPPQALERGFVVIPRTVTIALAEFFLCCQALVLWRWHSRDPLPIAFPCLALVTGIFALNQTLPLGTQTIYVFLVTVSLLLPTLLATSPPDSVHARPATPPWGAKFVLALVCASVVLGTWTVSEAWLRWLPDAQTWFATRVGRTFNERHRWRHYPISGSLTAIRWENSIDPNRTALKVYSDERPGYLAGRVFDSYEGSQWRIASEVGGNTFGDDPDVRRVLHPLDTLPDTLPDTLEWTGSNASTFELRKLDNASTSRRMAVENDPRRGHVFFTPLAWAYLRGAGESLTLDEYDIIRSGISTRVPYVFATDAAAPSTSLSASQRQRLLTPLADMPPAVAALADQICRRANTTEDKLRAVRAYFRDNYEYSIQPVEVPTGVDPLAHFLLSRHPAHCEFFASGVVALLRLQGIPARYATGFRVMDLDNENDGCWIARNRNAHAWAEAYDQQRKQWIIVEATPGFNDPTLEDSLAIDQDIAGAGGPSLAFATENANAIMRWWQSLPTAVRYTSSTLFTTAFGLAVVLVIRRRRSSQSLPESSLLTPRIKQWQRLLRRMDQRVKRRGLVRRHSETLHQFAGRIRAFDDAPHAWTHASADWYLDYAASRFGTANAVPPTLPPRQTGRNTPIAVE